MIVGPVVSEMSYCRPSDLHNWSDVYCYADVCGGYTVHVHNVRCLGVLPPSPSLDVTETLESAEERKDFVDRLKRHSTAVHLSKKVRIGGPCDGMTFNRPTALDCVHLLFDLRRMGYHVPQHAIQMLMEQSKEEVG